MLSASPDSSSSGGVNAGSDLNISPYLASALRPTVTEMSDPRGSPTACFQAGGPGTGLGFGPVPAAGAASAAPPPGRTGHAATPAAPTSTARREPPLLASSCWASLVRPRLFRARAERAPSIPMSCVPPQRRAPSRCVRSPLGGHARLQGPPPESLGPSPVGTPYP